MHISGAPVLLEQQRAHLIKNLSLIRTGLSFMGIVKFSIWLNIPNKYIQDLYAIVSVIVGYIFRKIN